MVLLRHILISSLMLSSLALAAPPTVTELNSQWIDNKETEISSELMDKIYSITEFDVRAKSHFDDLLRKANLENHQSLKEFMSLVRYGESDTRAAGFSQTTSVASILLTLSAPIWGRQVSTLRSQSFEYTESQTDIEHVITMYSRPEIVMRKDMTLLQAFFSLTHELTHYVGARERFQVDFMDYASEDDFVNRHIQEPGQEIQAYESEIKMAYYLKDHVTMPETLLVKPQEWLNLETGELTSRDAFVNFILITNNEHYKYKMKTDFVNTMIHNLNSARSAYYRIKNEYLPHLESLQRFPLERRAFYRNLDTHLKREEIVQKNRVCALYEKHADYLTPGSQRTLNRFCGRRVR